MDAPRCNEASLVSYTLTARYARCDSSRRRNRNRRQSARRQTDRRSANFATTIRGVRAISQQEPRVSRNDQPRFHSDPAIDEELDTDIRQASRTSTMIVMTRETRSPSSRIACPPRSIWFSLSHACRWRDSRLDRCVATSWHRALRASMS